MSKWDKFRIVFGCVWCFLIGLSADGPANIAGALGYAVGLLIVIVPIVWLIRGRKKPRDWDSITAWFFWLALILPSLTYASRHVPK